jgi:predicted component of type VI protein secretion system
MSILSDFEDRIGRGLEGGFARVFRAPVQPAELARKLGREMDRGKKLGVGKVYAPTLYNILLSRQDDQALGGFAETLSGELETYLMGYAREHNYELATRPVVRFLVDKELKLGRFEIIGELLSPEELAEELGYTPDPEPYEAPRDYVPESFSGVAAAGMPLSAPPYEPTPKPIAEPVSSPGIFDADGIDFDLTPDAAHAAAGAIAGAAAVAAGVEMAAPAPRTAAEASPTELLTPTPPLATVTVKGVDHDVVLTGDRAVVGRLATCEISLSDVNVSREHAAFEREGMGWAIRDLGSTNGTLVNGVKITRERLRDGDMIVIGITELIYHEPRG